MSLQIIGRKLTRLLASQSFFYVVIAFFVLQALWIACSAAYPMAFDEEFHVGVIRLFADGFSPFAAAQPESANGFSAIFRDPSYLYHFLMSLPYRLITVFTDNQTVIVLVLRFLNISMAVVGLLIFRKVLLRAKTSPALTNTALAIFALVPIVPQLAAHVSYDNLLFVLLAWMCLLVVRILDGLRARRLDIWAVGSLLLVCLASSIVKYESLPFIAAAMVFTASMIIRTFGRQTWQQLRKRGATLPRSASFALIALFVVLFGLVVQRYGVNLWQYQTLKPSCDMALSERRCEAFGPWARNHALEKTKGSVEANPINYTWIWLQSLHYRSFFAVSGPTNNYTNYPPVPLPAAMAIAITISGVTALILYGRRVFAGHIMLVFLAGMCALYLGALWLDNYSQFLETGQPVAINGRYLIPILLPLAAVFGRALSIALSSKEVLKPFIATSIILLFLQGGGVFTFIARSDYRWYWPNQMVIKGNENVQRVVKPLIIEGNKFY